MHAFAFLVLGPTLAAAQGTLPADVVLPGSDASPPAALLRTISLVVLDPGHGGDDLGSRDDARSVVEKELALGLARKAAARIQATTGARVLLTRHEDRTATAVERAQLANETRADLYLSIHANASPAPSARGFRVAFHDLTAPDRPSRPGAVLWSDAQRGVEGQSARFAETLRESLAAKVALPDRGTLRLPLAPLVGATCPAALLDVGTISNPLDAVALQTESVQDAIAEAIAEAVLRMDAWLR